MRKEKDMSITISHGPNLYIQIACFVQPTVKTERDQIYYDRRRRKQANIHKKLKPKNFRHFC